MDESCRRIFARPRGNLSRRIGQIVSGKFIKGWWNWNTVRSERGEENIDLVLQFRSFFEAVVFFFAEADDFLLKHFHIGLGALPVCS